MKAEELLAGFARRNDVCENLLQLLKAVLSSKYHAWCWKDREYLRLQLEGPLSSMKGPHVQIPVSCNGNG